MMILEGGLGSEEASQQQWDQGLKWGPISHKLHPDPTMQVSELPDMRIVNCCSL